MKPEMKKLIIANLPYLLFVYLFGKLGQAYRLAEGIDLSQKLLHFADGCAAAFESAAPSFNPFDLLIGVAGAAAHGVLQGQERQEIPQRCGVRQRPMWCIILTVRKTMWTQEVCT